MVLPAYNEARALPALLERLSGLRDVGLDLSVIVVDDGSTDGTSGVVMNWMPGAGWVRVLRHRTNRGLAGSLRTGLAAALVDLEDGGIVVVMDADDTHDPLSIVDMIPLIEGGADVVIGSRFAKRGGTEGVPLHCQLLSKGSSALLRAVCPLPGVKDYTSGFRTYRAGVLKSALRSRLNVFDLPGFSVTAGLLLALGVFGARFSEVPVTIRYDRKAGRSKMPVWKTVRGILALVRAYQGWRKRRPAWTR